jgi:hypothetical protein
MHKDKIIKLCSGDQYLQKKIIGINMAGLSLALTLDDNFFIHE